MLNNPCPRPNVLSMCTLANQKIVKLAAKHREYLCHAVRMDLLSPDIHLYGSFFVFVLFFLVPVSAVSGPASGIPASPDRRLLLGQSPPSNRDKLICSALLAGAARRTNKDSKHCKNRSKTHRTLQSGAVPSFRWGIDSNLQKFQTICDSIRMLTKK